MKIRLPKETSLVFISGLIALALPLCGCGKVTTTTQTNVVTLPGSTQTATVAGPTVTNTTTIAGTPVVTTQTATVTGPTTTVSVTPTYTAPITVGGTYKQLSPPILVFPADNQMFSNFPRTTTLTWQAVTGATKYKIEVQYFGSPRWFEMTIPAVTGTSCEFGFIGAQPGCWRVQAIDDTGANLPSAFSEWRFFRYSV